jgi:hypothetical protein
MFYHELQDDERQVLEQGSETPFTFALCDGQYTDESDAARRLAEEVAEASTWLAFQGVTGGRVDGDRGRLWVDREESGKVYWTLVSRYRVRREGGYNLVEPK